jgi:hypothetical protein
MIIVTKIKNLFFYLLFGLLALDPISSLFSGVYIPRSFRIVITTGISKSSCIEMNSSPIPDKYKFLTTSFFSSGINFGSDSYALL